MNWPLNHLKNPLFIPDVILGVPSVITLGLGAEQLRPWISLFDGQALPLKPPRGAAP